MELELRFFATFRAAVGEKTVHREFDDDATVGDVLRGLEAAYDGLEGEILDDAGDIRPQLSVLKNGREVIHLQGTATPMADGDSLSVFPPVAGGSESVERRKAFRGISERLARDYLVNLGGEKVGDHVVEGPDWRVETSAEKVQVAGSMQLTEVTVVFQGPAAVLEPLIEKFGRKAMRAGG
jgi:molybdopterin synthase sulfur carrier subunit